MHFWQTKGMLADATLVALELQPIGYKVFLTNTNKSIKHPITSVAQLCLHSWWSHMVFILIYLCFSIIAIRHLVPEYYQLTALVWIVNPTGRHLKWFEIWKGFEHFPGSIKCIFTIIGFQKLANVFIFFMNTWPCKCARRWIFSD